MVTWNYNGDADITLGEVKISKTAKIILIILLVILVICGGLSIYFRNYIYDFIANPQVVLSQSEINLEVHNEFIPEDYIANSTSEYTYDIAGKDEINIDKLGTYEVIYNSKNRIKSNSAKLTVNVVDTTPPEIKLTKDMLMLTRGKDTDKFNAKDYLESVSDNYSKPEKILIDFTTNIDFEHNDEIEVTYEAQDEAGNIATAKLNIAVYDSLDELIAEYEKNKEENGKEDEDIEAAKQEKEKEEAATQAQTEAQTQAQTEAPTQAQTEAPTEEPATEAPTTEAPNNDPWISGVHDITVTTSTDFGTMQAQLISGVSGSGTVYCDYSSVNLTVPGTYPVYWSSDDGASATCYVTVTE